MSDLPEGRAVAWRSRLSAASRLTRADWFALLRAQAALLQAEWLVRRRPRGELLSLKEARWLDENHGSDSVLAPAPSASAFPASAPPAAERLDSTSSIAGRNESAWRLARAVHHASRYGLFRPRCLTRAMALQRMLVNDGWPAEVRIGVRPENGSLVAHAWVEVESVILGDRPEHVATFAPLAGFVSP